MVVKLRSAMMTEYIWGICGICSKSLRFWFRRPIYGVFSDPIISSDAQRDRKNHLTHNLTYT